MKCFRSLPFLLLTLTALFLPQLAHATLPPPPLKIQNMATALAVDVVFAYDAYGRKVSRTEYDGSGAVVSRVRYVHDGWRLVQEVDATDADPQNWRVLADYVHGTGYVDDVVRSRRDLDAVGGFSAGEVFYHLVDQQFSTVGLVDANGDVVERYGYDAFGAPTIFDPSGMTIRSESVAQNDILYTGRAWDAALGAYDYRQRMYDSALGRFLSRDPAHDPANLGNPYTYVGNNPGAFVDPYGEWGIQFGTSGWGLGFGEPTLIFHANESLQGLVTLPRLLLEGVGGVAMAINAWWTSSDETFETAHAYNSASVLDGYAQGKTPPNTAMQYYAPLLSEGINRVERTGYEITRDVAAVYAVHAGLNRVGYPKTLGETKGKPIQSHHFATTSTTQIIQRSFRK